MTTAVLDWHPVITRHRDCITRTLRLVERGHDLLTTRWVIGLTGWTQRSAERYLNELWVAGLVDRHYRAAGCAHRWSITDKGRVELAGAPGG